MGTSVEVVLTTAGEGNDVTNANFHYWELTANHVKKAEALLSKGDDDSLTYACLELRKSLEAYAYDLLSRYLSEAPFRVVQRVWQADKVLKELLAIDPSSSSSSSLHMQPTPITEPETDVATLEAREPWIKIGEDRKLPVSDVRKYYHALGRFLHVPTVTATPSDKVRSKAEDIRDQLIALLAPGRIAFRAPSKMHELECDCGSTITRREASLVPGTEVECSNCGRQFEVAVQDEEIGFNPLVCSWDCPSCKTTRQMQRSEAIDGREFACLDCEFPVTVRKVPSWRIYYKK